MENIVNKGVADDVFGGDKFYEVLLGFLGRDLVLKCVIS